MTTPPWERIKQAIEVGQAMLEKQGARPIEMVEAAAAPRRRNRRSRQDRRVKLETKGGLDVGP